MFPAFLDGGASYDAARVVAATQANLVPIVGACAISFVGAYLQYFGAIRGGFRDRTHSIPLVGNLWFFAHDTTFIVNFHHWFHEVDFWLVKAFWFALVIFAICETVVTIQILRFSRQELFPGMGTAQALATYAGLQVMTYGVFWWFLSMIQDPFYYLSFATTVVLAPMFNIAMMRSRGSRRGFSQPMLIGFVLLSAGFWAWMFLSDPYFLQPFFWLVAAGNIAMSVAGVLEFRRLKPYGR
ncbi:MAG TPA: hypothetical protein VJM11_10885 [Nevskiaceae bacterium]|nr:hypothetical protein [Nevskiaceae bacterium]